MLHHVDMPDIGLSFFLSWLLINPCIYNFDKTDFTNVIATAKVITKSENVNCPVFMQCNNYE